MKNKILYLFLVIVIVAGGLISYKQLDFGGKTTIFFKIAFADENTMMRMPPKKMPPGDGTFKPPRGAKGEHGPPGGKGRHGKPGMGKVIYLGKVIPYTFILAFFILITRVLDSSIRKRIRKQ